MLLSGFEVLDSRQVFPDLFLGLFLLAPKMPKREVVEITDVGDVVLRISFEGLREVEIVDFVNLH